MSDLDLTSVLRGLEGFVAHTEAQIRAGLASSARDVQADMQATTAHGDITGATRASYRALVVGPGLDESTTVASGLAAVGRLNPGAEALEGYALPPETFGVVFTGFTSYLADLQVDYAGQKAVLKPTLDAFVDELTRAAAEGV